MSLEEFEAYVNNSGVNFEGLSDDKRIEYRAVFDRCRQIPTAGSEIIYVLTRLEKKVDDTKAEIAHVKAVNAVIVPLVCNLAIQNENPWSDSQIADSKSKSVNEHYRKAFLKHLGYNLLKRKRNENTKYPCMISGKSGDGDEVVVAHLMLKSVKVRNLQRIRMTEEDINSPRNFLLLASNIEKAFDNCQLSFIKANLLSTTLTMKIWDEQIREKPIWKDAEWTIGEFEGCSLNLSVNLIEHNPFRRVLSYHAYSSYLKFKHLSSEVPLEYGSDDQLEYFLMRSAMKTQVVRDIQDEVDSDSD